MAALVVLFPMLLLTVQALVGAAEAFIYRAYARLDGASALRTAYCSNAYCAGLGWVALVAMSGRIGWEVGYLKQPFPGEFGWQLNLWAAVTGLIKVLVAAGLARRMAGRERVLVTALVGAALTQGIAIPLMVKLVKLMG